MKILFLLLVFILVLVIIYTIYEFWPKQSNDEKRLKSILASIHNYQSQILELPGITIELQTRITEWVNQADKLHRALIAFYSDTLIPPLEEETGFLAANLRERNEAIRKLRQVAEHAEIELQCMKIDLSTLYTTLKTPEVIESVAIQERAAIKAQESIQQVGDYLQALVEVKLA